MKNKTNSDEENLTIFVSLIFLVVGLMFGCILQNNFGSKQYTKADVQEEVKEAIRHAKWEVLYLKEVCDYLGNKMNKSTRIKESHEMCVVDLGNNNDIELTREEVESAIQVIRASKK